MTADAKIWAFVQRIILSDWEWLRMIENDWEFYIIVTQMEMDRLMKQRSVTRSWIW